ncbi:penicillin-binding protein activator [Chitinivibrio alkaliphilus]|uniref:Periplasmic binding protein n=1 Tax=Chitinivibrio alkaliphilus ACht1 TaxID=1313304 RepID=U7DAV2_9BACT|nr:penicillin-binding protein activator [Chitinivibrio alkaliphilus]ERP31530.1 periplasmic binding protein [Chitinivibrio alkaliphilus ACht1]
MKSVLFVCLIVFSLIADDMAATIRQHLSDGSYATAQETAETALEDAADPQIHALLLESLLQQEQYAAFDSLTKRFEAEHSDTPEMARVAYLKGIGAAKRTLFTDAFEAFNDAAKRVDPETRRMEILITNVERLLEQYLHPEEVRAISHDDLAPALTETVTFYQAIHTKSVDHAKAQDALREFMRRYEESAYDTSLVIGTEAPPADRAPRSTLSLALLIPRTGSDSILGRHAEQAVELALHSITEETGSDISVTILDNASNSVTTARKMRRLIEDDTDVIIGPLMSDRATLAAAMLMDHPDILLISPTATDGGLAELGENIFQLNITPQVIAERIARYSVEQLSIYDFVVLSELTSYGNIVTEYFIDEVERMGGSILHTEHFSPSASDHREQFHEIKRFFALQELGKDKEDELTSRERTFVEEFVEDSTVNFGGLFMPSSVSNAVKLAAQVPFYKIQTQVLGTNSWDSNNLILDGGDYVRDMIFSTDYSLTEERDRWDRFTASYEEQFGESPQRLVVPLTYDAVHLIFEGMQRGRNVEDVQSHLAYTRGYNGLSGIISVDPESGRNTAVMIKRVGNREFIRID